MWCKEETLDDGRNLTETINKEHENVKYLPHHKLPENVVATSDLSEAVKDADILIFVIPHQFIKKTCDELKDKVKKSAFALTLVKVRTEPIANLNTDIRFFQGFAVDEKTNEVCLVSEIITQALNIPCLCLMGGLLITQLRCTRRSFDVF